MTEGMFFGCLAALFYFTVRFRETQAWWAVAGAGIALCLATLTRYDGWFLIPFVASISCGPRASAASARGVVFGLLASLGPLFWLVHNWC
jgi:4-amino-4-deoxy-L-arabinose transferase-like glycosyltransferase